eukprot:5103802-Prymnesium_polylepis.1
MTACQGPTCAAGGAQTAVGLRTSRSRAVCCGRIPPSSACASRASGAMKWSRRRARMRTRLSR